MKSIGVVIQARMGSARLPGKVLRHIGDRPLLGHVIGRLESLQHPARIVIATSDLHQDDPIVNWAAGTEQIVFRGSETDVLARYAACATVHRFSHVVRLTADNPFTDVEELDNLIRLHINGAFDYSHSFGSLPIGVGAEIFTFDALMKSEREGKAPHHREHVNEFAQENSHIFRTGVLSVCPEKQAPDMRLTVDTFEDWQRADCIARAAANRWISTKEAIALCTQSA
jgi:spore coat polysaccharide biosynthesis protein SpsF